MIGVGDGGHEGPFLNTDGRWTLDTGDWTRGMDAGVAPDTFRCPRRQGPGRRPYRQSGLQVVPPGVATSRWPSGTSCQPASSSWGSLATTTPPRPLRQDRLAPRAVAAIVVRSMSIRLSRPPTAFA